MATSSIFASFDIKETKKAKSFAEALKTSINNPKCDYPSSNCKLVTDSKEIDDLLNDWNTKHCNK